MNPPSSIVMKTSRFFTGMRVRTLTSRARSGLVVTGTELGVVDVLVEGVTVVEELVEVVGAVSVVVLVSTGATVLVGSCVVEGTDSATTIPVVSAICRVATNRAETAAPAKTAERRGPTTGNVTG